jgi:hypothetical protein
VVVRRPLAAEEAATILDVAALRASAELAVITAVGSGPAFAYHAQKAVATVAMYALDAPTCLCDDSSRLPFGAGKGKLLYT